jgi:hypothetical protein
VIAHTRNDEASPPPSPTPRVDRTTVANQIAEHYWLVERGIDEVVGVIVGQDNGTYVVYCDDIPVAVFANAPAAVEYAERG